MTSYIAEGELGCFLGGESRGAAAGKASCAEAGWDVLPTGRGGSVKGLEELWSSLCEVC